MAAIALDRFTSVAQPLRYNHFITMSYVHKFIILCWIYSFLLGFIPFLIVNEVDMSIVIVWMSLLLYLPCFISIVLSYGYIYVIARSHARAIYGVEISVSLNNGGITDIDADTSIHHNRYGVTLALILGTITLCWTPIQICSAIDTFGGTKILQSRWRSLLGLPIVFSSMINPWVYGYRSSEVRLAVARIVDAVVTKVTGRPPNMSLFYQTQNNKEMTSCASNVRLLAISPTQTTVQCCSNGGDMMMNPPSPNPNVKKQSQHHLHVMMCDQMSQASTPL